MRRSYLPLLLEILRRGGLARGALLVRHLARLATGGSAPLFATIAVTYRCNYACGMCDLPQRAEAELPRKDRLLAAIRDLSRRGTLAIGLTGGEPMLRNDLAEIVAAATGLGLLCHVNTNGSRLTRARCDELLRARPCSINVSLDGAIAATHDRLRGVPGSFVLVLAGVEQLLAARAAQRARTRVRLVMALARANAGEVEGFAEVASTLGVDGFGFLPVHDFTGRTGQPLQPQEVAMVAAAVARVRAGPHAHRLDNSRRYLSGMLRFLGGAAMPSRCSAPRAHVAIDPWFRAHPCVPMMSSGMPGKEPGASIEQPPAEVCQRCWWNCHRELDLALHNL
ncbi:MAG: radical SAM protein [Planctomycetota bacterium]